MWFWTLFSWMESDSVRKSDTPTNDATSTSGSAARRVHEPHTGGVARRLLPELPGG